MSYELFSTGEENDYRYMSDGGEPTDESYEQEIEWIKDVEDALAYLEETKEARVKEHELADFLEQGGKSAEVHIEEDFFQTYYQKREEEFNLALVKANEEAKKYKQLYWDLQDKNDTSKDNVISELEKKVIELTNRVQEEQKKFLLVGKPQIDVKEFELLFSVKESSQKRWRGRHHDPLPSQQYEDGGKRYYMTKEVLKWMENYAK